MKSGCVNSCPDVSMVIDGRSRLSIGRYRYQPAVLPEGGTSKASSRPRE